MDRLHNRNRDGESDIGIDYQEQLLKKHDHVFDHIDNVIKITTNDNFINDQSVLYQITDKIDKFLFN